MRESVIFYRSFYEAIKELEPQIQAEVYNAIFNYGLNFAFPENLSPVASVVFKLVKPQLDANIKRYENGKKGAQHGNKGGRPKQPQNNPTETPKKPLTNPTKTPKVKEKDNEKDNEKGKEKKSTPPSIFEFTEYAKDKAVERNMNLDENKLTLKYESWKENDWRTGKGTKIKNWKATLLNTLPYLQKEKNQENKNSESVMARLSRI